MRNKNKSKLIILDNFLPLNNAENLKEEDELVVLFNNFYFSLIFINSSFVFYNGVDLTLLRIRIPFNYFKTLSFVSSRPDFDLIPYKFKDSKKKKKVIKKVKKIKDDLI